MQASWRQDPDKLTFIVCDSPDTAPAQAAEAQDSVTPGKQDAPGRMIGDVNLFLYDDEDEEENEGTEERASSSKKEKSVIGELEIMIAVPSARGRGLARETLVGFMWYITISLSAILAEYQGSSTSSSTSTSSSLLKYLRVKIDKDNVKSISLFEKLGFARTRAEANYFGEVELRTPVVEGRLVDVESQVRLEGFSRMVRYE